MNPPYVILRSMRLITPNARYVNIPGGRKATPEYKAWQHMKNRCTNPNEPKYSYYGGRGIKVCERWQSFDNFLEDMGKRPHAYTLDRKDSNGDYTPENCRWATRRQQAINRSLHGNNTTGYRGVSLTVRGTYIAKISTDSGLRASLGYFEDSEQAAIAYDCAAIQIYGKDARLNIL